MKVERRQRRSTPGKEGWSRSSASGNDTKDTVQPELTDMRWCFNLGVTVKVRKGVFYSRKLDNFVVDSMCVCGHLESEHGSLNKTVNKRIVRHPG